jgi:hypothetical protein
MAWMWWLLAPIVSTVAGAGLLWWRAWREPGSTARPAEAMREHQAVVRALSRPSTDPLPVTMLVLEAAAAD